MTATLDGERYILRFVGDEILHPRVPDFPIVWDPKVRAYVMPANPDLVVSLQQALVDPDIPRIRKGKRRLLDDSGKERKPRCAPLQPQQGLEVKAMRDRGLSSTEVAKEMGISLTTVFRWQRGTRSRP